MAPRSVFRAAIAVFTLASMLCGFCDNLAEMTAARVLQGIGGAMMVPVGRLVLLRSIDRSELVRAISYLTTPAILGPILGPPVGGLITTYFSWRWVFFLNLPIGALGIVLVTLLIEDTRAEAPPPLDWLGFVLTGAALSCLMYGARADRASGGGGAAIVRAAGGRRGVRGCSPCATRAAIKAPLIDLSLLRVPTFAVSVSGGGIFRMTAGAMPFLLPLMLQVGFGMTAFGSGLITLASGIGSLFNKMSTGPDPPPLRLSHGVHCQRGDRGGRSSASARSSRRRRRRWVMFGLLLVGGYFRSLQFTALNSLAFAEITSPQMSAATSLSSMMQQLTNGLGVAFAAIALHVAHVWRGASASGALATPDFHAALIAVDAVLAHLDHLFPASSRPPPAPTSPAIARAALRRSRKARRTDPASAVAATCASLTSARYPRCGGRAAMDDHRRDDAAAPRCRWCGLVMAREDRDAAPARLLCGTCATILGDADWQALLGRGGDAAVPVPQAMSGDDGRRRRMAKK